MTNHFHLLLRCPDGGVSTSMHHLLSNYARIVNDSSGRVGHLFGDRFCSRLVTTIEYLANVVRYIHLNPLDIVGVADVTQYRWSSHRTYLRQRPRPDWLTTDTIAGWFDDLDAFDRFVRSRQLDPHRPVVAEPGDLISTIDLMLAERSDSAPRHLPAQRRAIALLLADSMTAAARDEVLQGLGVPSDGARRTAFSRARRLWVDEPVVVDVAERVRGMFEQRPIGRLDPSRVA